MSQQDLFGGATPPDFPVYRPDPDMVRSRLVKILSEARAAATLPWEPTRVSLYRTIVPDMIRWLPEEEAARWRAEFEEQLIRLGVAA